MLPKSTITSTIVLSISILILLSGCATLNKDECLNSDWRLIGYEDGIKGYDRTRIGEHRRACAKHGVRPEVASYNQGMNEGLREFCKPARAYRFGLGGGTYNGVCPREDEASFQAAYSEGRKIYQTREHIRRNKNKVSSKEKALAENNKKLKEKEGLLVKGNTTSAQRTQHLAKVKELSKEQQKLEEEIYTLKRENEDLEKQLSHMESRSYYQ